jgi:hypothetical protein
MATKSTRNLSFEQAQAMWPGITFSEGETFTVTPMEEPANMPIPASVRFNFPTVPKETIDKIREQMGTEAVKADNGKPDWSLVPFEALEGMVRVLEFGAKKYSRNNWMTGGGFSYRRVLTACMRHLFSYLGGEDKDPESGLSHIHHAQCNLLFIAMYLTNKEKFNKDDRESR